MLKFFKKREEKKQMEFNLKCETLYQFVKKRFTCEQQVINEVDIHPCIKARQFVLDLINNGQVDEKFKLLWQRKTA